MKRGGNQAFIKAIQEVQTTAKASDKNATQPAFPALETKPATTDKATAWKKDITHSLEAIFNANKIETIRASAQAFINQKFEKQDTKPAIINISQTEAGVSHPKKVSLYHLYADKNNQIVCDPIIYQKGAIDIYENDKGDWKQREREFEETLNLVNWPEGYYLVVGKTVPEGKTANDGVIMTANALLLAIKPGGNRFVTAWMHDMPKSPASAIPAAWMIGADPVQYSIVKRQRDTLREAKVRIAKLELKLGKSMQSEEVPVVRKVVSDRIELNVEASYVGQAGKQEKALEMRIKSYRAPALSLIMALHTEITKVHVSYITFEKDKAEDGTAADDDWINEKLPVLGTIHEEGLKESQFMAAGWVKDGSREKGPSNLLVWTPKDDKHKEDLRNAFMMQFEFEIEVTVTDYQVTDHLPDDSTSSSESTKFIAMLSVG